MKKLIGLICMVSSGLFAATSGTLLLKGTVPAELSIDVTPESIATALPLNTTQTGTKVATINEKSNSNTGYNVAISSNNLGKLIHSTVGTSYVAYQLTYDGNTVDLANGQTFTYSSASAVDTNRDVNISYTGIPYANLVQGDYTDTVTFVISAN